MKKSLMQLLKTPQEIKIMSAGGRIAGEVLDLLIDAVRPGITTLALDALAEEWIKVRGGEPSFKKVPGYSHTLCTSVNNQVVHGIPNDQKLQNGDIVTLDLGVYYQGFHTDTAWTVGVGPLSVETDRFLQTGQEALTVGIGAAQVNNKTGDISAAIESVFKRGGVHYVSELNGHGVGRELHEDPLVPNFGQAGTGVKLEQGMTVAIEPIYTDADPEVFMEDDGWTIVALYSKLAASFEHTVAITDQGPQILTLRPSERV